MIVNLVVHLTLESEQLNFLKTSAEYYKENFPRKIMLRLC